MSTTGEEAKLAAELRAAITDLDGYIERHAVDRAAPLIAAARAEAGAQVTEARHELTRTSAPLLGPRCAWTGSCCYLGFY
jgi:hypothetical protein